MTTFWKTSLLLGAFLTVGATFAQAAAPAPAPGARPAAPAARPAAPATAPTAAPAPRPGAPAATAPAPRPAAPAPAVPLAAAPAAPPAAPGLVVKDAGLTGSTAVRYDLYHDRYLVTNSGGYVTSIVASGKVDQLKFIDGKAAGNDLAAPTGIFVRENRVYVLEATKGVRVFDLAGKPCAAATCGSTAAKYDIPGAIALSGIAVTADGVIFVTDAGRTAAEGAVYRIGADAKPVKIASGAATKRPAAIDINAGRGAVSYITGDASDLVTLDQNGRELSRVDLKIGKLAGGLAATDSGFLVQAQDGATYLVDASNKTTELAEGNATGNGIGWDFIRNKVAIAVPSTGVAVVAGPKAAGL
jgi:hypothetical protein